MSNNNIPSKEEALQALAFIEDIWEMAPDLPYTKKLRAFISGAPDNQPQGELNATRLDTNDRATAGNRGARPDLQHIARDGHEPGSSCVESHPLRGGDGMVVGDITPSTRPGCAGVHLPLDASAASAPLGWLYDWTHSSALGKPDEHFTGFTTDETYARKHDNPRPVWGSPDAAPAGCVEERDCTQEPWCRINGKCERATPTGVAADESTRAQDGLSANERHELIGMLREAAGVISAIPEDVAERLQVRHFLPDELEGGALIVEGLSAPSPPAFTPAEPTGESTGAAPDERKLIGALQSLLDRMANDPRTGLMFEADGDTLRDAMTFVRRTARARAFAAPPSEERTSAPAPEGIEPILWVGRYRPDGKWMLFDARPLVKDSVMECLPVYASAPAAAPLTLTDEDFWLMAMRKCGVLHGDVLHMSRKQVVALGHAIARECLAALSNSGAAGKGITRLSSEGESGGGKDV